MLEELKFKRILQEALSSSSVAKAQIAAIRVKRAVTRFNAGEIHQNIQEVNFKIQFKVIHDNKTGIYFTNRLELKTLKNALKQAYALARNSNLKASSPDLPLPAPYARLDGYNQATAELSAADRVSLVQEMLSFAQDFKVKLSGSFWNQILEIGIANTYGLWAYFPLTAAGLTLISSKEEQTGFAQWGGRNLKDLDNEALVKEAVSDCLIPVTNVKIKLAGYPVILAGYATAEILSCLGEIAFNAQALYEGSSFICGRKGEQVLSPEVSIYDDAYDLRGVGMPFDYEGVPKQKVTFIEKGVVKGVVSDRAFAFKLGLSSTGHCAPPEFESSAPKPLSMVMASGNSSLKQIMSSVPKALLVKRFHYMRVMDEPSAMVTGLTRDGLFLVSKGEVVGRCPDLRFNQSLIKALKGVRAVSKETKSLVFMGDAGFESYVAPAVCVEGFNFLSF
jgi:PmbA protein